MFQLLENRAHMPLIKMLEDMFFFVPVLEVDGPPLVIVLKRLGPDENLIKLFTIHLLLDQSLDQQICFARKTGGGHYHHKRRLWQQGMAF